MRTVNLCKDGGCCPVVKLADEYVEIGEAGNLCRLNLDEWNTLREKIISGKL